MLPRLLKKQLGPQTFPHEGEMAPLVSTAMQFLAREESVRSIVTELVDLENEFSIEPLDSAGCGLLLAGSYVATPIPLFVSFEVGTIDTL